MWATRSVVPKSTVQVAQRVGGLRLNLVEWAAVGVVAGEAARAVEHREGAIWVVVDPHPRSDEVVAERARWDLQGQAAVAHAVVVADHPFLLHAEDVGVGAGAIGDEPGLRLLGRDREAGVMLGQVSHPDELVGGLDRGDAGERQLPGAGNRGTRRSWRVPNARSERPRASGE